MSTTLSREITAEDVQQALTAALGPHYKVTAKSGSSLRVKGNATSWATVHISWSPGHTSFRVHGRGLVVLRLIRRDDHRSICRRLWGTEPSRMGRSCRRGV